ncbi:hypothetical protein TRFO_06447 [Tritrichomonas foetus]|uniref:Uncharacterized protein n=1 Tax=Tritrichomonas foetus TaxID=1144522 RepID=A0A1J4JYA2_9EUKA|nr:hypothetical protein TRFO_06447 [Tritrichomonas foetus]|eukprot:OHT04135.1 hypothetical protein TRFO_06447 [Tritrichomonas foetus]
MCFEEADYELASAYAEVQEAVMSISNDNIHEIVKTLINSQFKNDTKFINDLILTAAHYRPLKLHELALMTGQLFEHINGLKSMLLIFPLRVLESRWHIAFILECNIAGVISDEDALFSLHKYHQTYPAMGTRYLIFQYFSRIVKTHEPEYYQEFFDFLKEIMHPLDFDKSPNFLNESPEYEDQVRNWYPKNSIERIIRDDDLNSFKEIVAQNPEFDVNSRSHNKSVFCYSQMLRFNVSYLELAAFFGSFNIFSFLVQTGANRFNLHLVSRFAIAGGNFDIVEMCDIDDDINKSIEAASEYFRFSIFQWIFDTKLDNIEDVEATKASFLHFCAKANNIQMLLFLLDQGCDINKPDETHWTPLHYAANERCIEAIKVILKCKNLNLEPGTPYFIFILISYQFYFLLFLFKFHISILNRATSQYDFAEAQNLLGFLRGDQ